MNQSGSTRVWPLISGIAAMLLALNFLFWMFDEGISGPMLYIYALGMILAALAGFLHKNEQAAKYLQVAAAVLMAIYLIDITMNYMELSKADYAPAGLFYGYAAKTAAWIVLGVVPFVRTRKPTFFIVNAVLSLIMLLMLMRYIGGVGFLGTMGRMGGMISQLLEIVILLGLTAPRVAEAPRQAAAPVGSTLGSLGVADELLKYKQLLDQGVLTEEEYEEKKKKLLGL